MANRARIYQTAFAAGEIDPRAQHRRELAFVNAGCHRLRNWAIVTGDAVTRRPGSYVLANVDDDATRLKRIRLIDDVVVNLVFAPTKVQIVDDTGTVIDTVTSCPWDADDIPTLQITAFEDWVEVVSQSFAPRKLTHDGAGNWSIASVAFDTGSNGQVYQPYLRIAPRGVTIAPSATTGSINLTLSAGYWETSHVGSRVRIFGREVLITSRTSSTVAVGTVQQTLYPTHTLTVGSTAGFEVGQEIVGDTTGVRAIVASIASGTSMTATYLGFSPFDTASSEKIISATGFSTVTASVSTTPASTVVWDEALISAAVGYPGGSAYHRGRHYYFDFAKRPSWIAASTVNEPLTFDEGDADLDDAISDGLGDRPSARIRHAIPAEQLVLLTDQGSYYVPESGDLPIAPTTISFARLGPEVAGDCRPTFATEGVVWADGSRVYLIAPTGNVRRSWDVLELAEMAAHLINDPVRAEVIEGIGDEPTRYIAIVNGDGSLAVMRYVRGAEIVGWQLWYMGDDPTEGGFLDLEARERSVLALISIEGGVRLVSLSFDALLDSQQSYAAAANKLVGDTGVTLLKNNLAHQTGSVSGSGVFQPDSGGTVAAATGLALGHDFSTEMIPLPPSGPTGSALAQVEAIRPRLVNTRRLIIASEPVSSVDGYASAWDMADGLPLRTWTPEISILDSGEDDQAEIHVTFRQDEAAACTVSAVSWRLRFDGS